jgi:prepilin-type N-terminal cleavage/methylation domain-containing protein
MNNRIRKGFTLVELLIVVVILGILAAVVVPQFTNATSEATAGNLKAQLTSIQNQIELYAARNNGTYPFPAAAGAATWNNLTTGGAYLTLATKNGIETVIGTTKGSATNAWVWNSADRTLYASNFNETTGAVSTTATD